MLTRSTLLDICSQDLPIMQLGSLREWCSDYASFAALAAQHCQHAAHNALASSTNQSIGKAYHSGPSVNRNWGLKTLVQKALV